MKRLNIYIAEEELERVRTAQKCSGMYLSGGRPIGDPQEQVEQLRKQYKMPEGTALDISNGEFVES